MVEKEEPMPGRIKITVVICLVALSVLSASSCVYSYIKGMATYGFFPGPKLLSPTTEDVDLSGKDQLEFRWERTNLVVTQYFDFRLYKGYDTVEGTRILQQDFSTDNYPITIPSSSFETGQVYTWVLRQVFLNGDKSDKSWSSFKIIGK